MVVRSDPDPVATTGGMMNRTASFAMTVAGCVVLGALGSATVARAQNVSSFRDLQVSLKGGERLTVTDKSGASTTGRLVALSDQSLRITSESAGAVDFAEGSILRIDQLRSRKGKGALRGFVAGFVGGLVAVAVSPDTSTVGPSKGSAIVPVAAIFGGIGTGIGAIIGAARPERRIVFQAPIAVSGRSWCAQRHR
jgi:hypothetical protein